MRLLSLTVILLGLITYLGLAQGTPTVPDHVVISEVCVNGSGGSTDEFVELYNPTNSAIDLTAWKLQYKSATGVTWSSKVGDGLPESTSIQPHGFFLLAGSGYSGGVSPDYAHTANWGLADAAGHVRLIDNSSVEIDKVGYGSTADSPEGSVAPKPPAGESIQRKSLKVGYAPAQDTDDNSADFETTATPTPMDSSDTPVDPAPVMLEDGAGNFQGGYKAIRDGVDAALAGYTLNVAAGTYSAATNGETFPITVDKANLTIKSITGATTTFIEPTPDDQSAFEVMAAGVTIGGSGFTITAGGRGGIYADVTGGNGITVQDNIFKSYGDGESRGMWFEKLWNGASITGNSFTAPRVGTGIMVVNADGATIENNTVASGTVKYCFLTFKAEAFYPARDGVDQYTPPWNEYVAESPSTINNVSVTGNEITGMGERHVIRCAASIKTSDHGEPQAQDLTVGTGGVNISGNTFANNGIGVRIDADKAAPNAPGQIAHISDVDYISIHYNNFVGNTAAVDNGQLKLLDAENNWWGANDGPSHSPGSGDKVSANVDYDPWIQFALAADPNQLVVGGSSTLTTRFQDSDGVFPVVGIDQLPLYQEAKKVTFETDLGAVGSTTITKDLPDGQATATLTSTTSGTATVTAQAKDARDNLINGTQDTTTVEFLAAVSGIIELAADPLNIVADGSSASTITATVRDGYGNLVTDGTSVAFTTNRGTMASTHPTTNGVAQATLTSGTEPGVTTVNAQANGASADIAVFFKEPDGADVSGAKTEKTEPGDDTVDAKDETGCEIDKSGDGTPTITAARYECNPGGTPCFSASEGGYFDVHLDDSTGVDEVVIRYYYPTDVDESSLVMYWWDGSYWQICSNYWVNTTDTNGYGGYMAARITATSTPNLDDLSGQIFAVGVAAESVFRHRYYNKSGYWMISLPFTPDPTGVIQLQDDLGAGAPVYTYDPAVGDYIIPTELCVGQAYWAWFDGTTDIDATGHKFSGSPQRINCAIAGWHMIGPAFLRSLSETIRWGDVWVEHDGETVTSVRAAAELGWLKSFVIRYDPDVSEDYCYWVGYDEAILVPWEGYWVMTLLPNVTLQFHFIPAPPLSVLALDDPQALGFHPTGAGIPLPLAPPTSTSEIGAQWWVTTAVDANAAQFQVIGPLASHVDAIRLHVFDLSGQRIYKEEASDCKLTWPYAASSGERLANGLYLVHLLVRIDGLWETGELMKILILR